MPAVPILESQKPSEAPCARVAANHHNTEATAVVYCEGNFGAIDGKTANGLVRHSERYKILSIIDSDQVGLDSGNVLDGTPNSIPICRNLADALEQAGSTPDYFIFGMAPASGMLSRDVGRSGAAKTEFPFFGKRAMLTIPERSEFRCKVYPPPDPVKETNPRHARPACRSQAPMHLIVRSPVGANPCRARRAARCRRSRCRSLVGLASSPG